MSRGYVYILEVSDIDLPVCKIGRTIKTPQERCAAINRSSTGDFLWQVAYEFSVSDCDQFERIVHKKLEPFRQKGREFFNVSAEVADNAVRSILDRQTEIQEVEPQQLAVPDEHTPNPLKAKKPRGIKFRQKDSEYADILALFAGLTGCKGRPFGQLNKPYFGMSDGNEGVQWNIAIYTDPEEIQLGVNLEGLTYANWPITTLILNELANPMFFEAKEQVAEPERIYLRMTRDAWQAASRPSILEKYIGLGDISIQVIKPHQWKSMLIEALECLSEDKGYRGRSKQKVTLAKQPNRGEQVRTMEVSPHLTVWTPIETAGDMESNLKMGRDGLTPVYNWMSSASQ